MNPEIAWAAGLFEGEGCLYAWTKNNRVYPLLMLSSTDPDVVERFARVMDANDVIGNINGPYWHKENSNAKPHWKWQAGGWHNLMIVGDLFGPWLGERRLHKFAETFADRPTKIGTRHKKRSIPNRLVAQRV